MADTLAAFVIERVMEWGVFQVYSHQGGGINGITAAQCKGGDEGPPRRAVPAA
jgi:hypothetical protein